MSTRQVVVVVRNALRDATDGLAATMQSIGVKEGLVALRADLVFPKWITASDFQPGMSANVFVVPSRSANETRDVNALPVQRDGAVELRITYDFQGPDPAEAEDNILVAAAALDSVLDSLRDYSDANGGTVQAVVSPVTYEFGTFETAQNGTGAGFVCTVTIQERGTE